jgi:DNA-binding MarR family transcriptional regulator
MAASRLRTELKKKRPFETAEEEALLNLFRTTDRLDIRFKRLFREYGLTGPQYNILRTLRGEGAPLPILEIGSRMLTAVPAITGLIDRLEEAGFVTRKRCEEDRRVIYIAATDKALKLLGQIDEPLRKLQHDLAGHLSKGELAELSRLLEKLRSAANEDG